MSKIVILGGGASGLSAAYYLSKFPGLNIAKLYLIEGSSQVGGWIQTTRFDDGSVFEHGPRSMRAAGKSGMNTLNLVEELGLESEVLAIPRSHPAARNRFIYANKKLCPLPNGPTAIFKRQEPFSKPLALIGWKEPFKKSVRLHDESIYDFFTRRFSRELAEYLADPLCRGIYAGDCRQLSVKSCFPDVFKLEQEHGSIIRGFLKKPKEKKELSGLAARQAAEKWPMWSLRHGLAQLPDAMLEVITSDPRVTYISGKPVSKVTFGNKKAKVHFGDEEVEVDHVISSILAKRLAGVLGTEHEQLSSQLSQIPAVTVGVVNLEYEDVTLPVQGFGHLIPSCEKNDVLGILYESLVFKEHNRSDGRAMRLTCMMGGAWFEEYFGNPDNADLDQLKHVAMREVQKQLGISKEPTRVIVNLQRDCISQYLVGHADILASMASYISDKQLPLQLVGASYLGASVNDCIYNARIEAEKLAKQITT